MELLQTLFLKDHYKQEQEAGDTFYDIQEMDIEVDIHEQKWKVGPSHLIHVVTTKPQVLEARKATKDSKDSIHKR